MNYTYDDTSTLCQNANSSRSVFIRHMVIEGVITQEQADKMNEYTIIVERPGILGSLIKEWFQEDYNKNNFICVKVLKP